MFINKETYWENIMTMKNDTSRVCPVWMAYLFDNPLRGLFHQPEKLYGKYLKPGMKALDLGCGMGFMSIGMAKMVGYEGQVFSIDMQQGMLDRMLKRARRKGLDSRITPVQCSPFNIGDVENADFALAFWMLHETPDYKRTLAMLHQALKPGGHLFLAEPRQHIDKQEFTRTLDEAKRIGFKIVDHPDVKLSFSIVLQKQV